MITRTNEMKNLALLALLIGLSPLRLLGQVLDFSFHYLSEENGLTQAEHYYISQDSEGFTWIGTDDGLLRFDGQNIIKYQQDSKQDFSLEENIVTSPCYEDGDGNLWFSSFSALHCYRRKSDDFIHFELDNGLTNYRAFFLENDTKVWLQIGSGQENSLHIFDISSNTFEQRSALKRRSLYCADRLLRKS